MFRMWVKLWKENRLVKDMVYETDEETNRTAKIFKGIEVACNEWDLAQPIWLDKNIRDFKAHARCRFSGDNFSESIEFDYFEIHVIEEA